MAAVRDCRARAAAVRFKRADRRRLLVHRARHCALCSRRCVRLRAGSPGARRSCRHCGRRLRAGACTNNWRSIPGSAQPHPIWHEAAAALGMPLHPSVSIARNQPWFELGRPLVCMLAITCGFLVGADRGRARQLLKVIAWSGAAYAVYGILAHLIDPTHILWREKEAYLAYVTGTFINRNTAAAYFGSCAVVWSLLLWERVG